MSKNNKMKCPDCGADMNRHAEKVDYTAALNEPDKVDPHLGGIVEEVHTCPRCGKTEVRESN